MGTEAQWKTGRYATVMTAPLLLPHRHMSGRNSLPTLTTHPSILLPTPRQRVQAGTRSHRKIHVQVRPEQRRLPRLRSSRTVSTIPPAGCLPTCILHPQIIWEVQDMGLSQWVTAGTHIRRNTYGPVRPERHRLPRLRSVRTASTVPPTGCLPTSILHPQTVGEMTNMNLRCLVRGMEAFTSHLGPTRVPSTTTALLNGWKGMEAE